MAKMKSAFNSYEDKVEEVIEPIVESVVEEIIPEPVVEVKEEVVEPEVVEESWPRKYICRNKCWVSTKKKLYLQGETELFEEGEFIPSHFDKC